MKSRPRSVSRWQWFRDVRWPAICNAINASSRICTNAARVKHVISKTHAFPDAAVRDFYRITRMYFVLGYFVGVLSAAASAWLVLWWHGITYPAGTWAAVGWGILCFFMLYHWANTRFLRVRHVMRIDLMLKRIAEETIEMERKAKAAEMLSHMPMMGGDTPEAA